MHTFAGFDGLVAARGQEIGVSEWRSVTQDDIDGFAALTGDDNWVHVDRERAAAGPYGTTIAHGYFTLSLIPRLARSVYRMEGIRVSVNYGCEKIRFPAPVPVGSRVRARITVAEVTIEGEKAVLTFRTAIEIEGFEKPGCVAHNILHLRR
jgi:acyl dehydratase